MSNMREMSTLRCSQTQMTKLFKTSILLEVKNKKNIIDFITGVEVAIAFSGSIVQQA